MNRMLGPESKFYAALSLFADLVIVNVLLVITCFPVFTGGMSLRTAHAVTGQMVREEGSRRGSAFVRGLLTRPGVNTAWWLICLAVGALAAYEFAIIAKAELGTMGVVLRAALLSGLIVIGCISVWFFHLDAPGVSFSQRCTTAIMKAVAHLPRTLLAVCPWALLVLYPLFFPAQWGGYLFFLVVLGPALAVYLAELALQWPELSSDSPDGSAAGKLARKRKIG